MDNNCMVDQTQRGTYTASQIAEILGISVRKAYELCDTTNNFRVMRLGKRCVRIHKESFDLWFNEQFSVSPNVI
jgi:hypothetical protein